MIYSMTGYGRAQLSLNGSDITVELRSVNSRYLDLNIKLHRAYAFAEDKVRQYLTKRFARGKMDVYVTVDDKNADNVAITLNEDLLKRYIEIFDKLSTQYGLRNDLTAVSAAKLPDVLTEERAEIDQEQMSADILAALTAAADSFEAMRLTEGEALVRDVRGQMEKILTLVTAIEERSPQTVEEYRKRLEQKLAQVLEGRGIDEARIITEAAIFADRVDVNEETVRLRSHVAQMDDMLTKGGSVGRKLDFLVQEMNREVNTIGSKCSDLQSAGTVVEMKSVIEKIREQIANIE